MADNSTPLETAVNFLKYIKLREAAKMNGLAHPEGTACLIRQGKPMYLLLKDIPNKVCEMDSIERDEVSYDEIEHVDGDFATVWTPYRFYENGKLHHTGTNNFVLWKSPEKGWLITAVQDVARMLEGVRAENWEKDSRSLGGVTGN